MDNDVEVIFEVVNRGLNHFIVVCIFLAKPGWKSQTSLDVHVFL